MNWFKNLPTAAKLAVGFGTTLILAVMVGTTALTRMSQMNDIADALANKALKNTQVLSALAQDMLRVRAAELRGVIADEASDKATINDTVNGKLADIDNGIQTYKSTATDEADKQNMTTVVTLWGVYRQAHEKLLAVDATNDQKKIVSYVNGESLKRFNATTDKVNEMVAWNKKQADDLARAAADGYSRARTAVVLFLSVAVVLGLLLAWAVTMAIVPPLNRMSKMAEQLAAGDVEQEVKLRTKDEVGKLAASFRDMIAYQKEMAIAAEAMAVGDLSVDVRPKSGKDVLGNAFVRTIAYQKEMARVAETMAGGDLTVTVQPKSEKDVLGTAFSRMVKHLSELIAQARVASDSIAQAAGEVSSGNEDLSQRTTEQASSLEETASSMEEMTSTVKQNAENAREANQLAAQAREVAERGGAVVSSAVSSMEEINTASKRIADIISVIDEIAFQTNLLALNAAVEAARVGEQGRGFAVVAAEVRNLAGRSATAAKEIKALVQDTVGKVHDGTELVNQSGEQLTEIVRSIQKVADIIAEISAASQEQSAGIEQVNKAVMQMDQITQQNAALVEEASAASQATAQQARDLQSLVSRFKVDQSFLESLQRSVNAQMAAATGTHGMRPTAASPRKPAGNIRLVSQDEEFEAF